MPIHENTQFNKGDSKTVNMNRVPDGHVFASIKAGEEDRSYSLDLYKLPQKEGDDYAEELVPGGRIARDEDAQPLLANVGVRDANGNHAIIPNGMVRMMGRNNNQLPTTDNTVSRNNDMISVGDVDNNEPWTKNQVEIGHLSQNPGEVVIYSGEMSPEEVVATRTLGRTAIRQTRSG